MASASVSIGNPIDGPRFDPNGPDEWDEYDMTEEEEKVYYKQVRETDGFDVDEVPGRLMFHQIRPFYILENDEESELMMTLAKQAIDEYNSKEKLKDDKGELEYYELLKVTHQLLCGFLFRLTFNAKNFALNGEIRTYQAAVLMGVEKKPEVQSFRPLPTGSNDKWYWQRRCCAREQPINEY